MLAPLIRRFLRMLFARIGASGVHRLRVVFADRSEYANFATGEPEVTIVFRSPRGERRTLIFFYQGFFDAWIDGEIDIAGEWPIAKLAALAHAAFAATPGASMPVNPLVRIPQRLHEWRHNNRDPAQARRNAEFHYDIDPRFFAFKLGATLGYSEGYWVEGTRSLDQAKYNNYEYICRKLRLQPGMRVLEVGSGWGYMPILLAKKYGATVTVYNPVRAQNDYMVERFRRHGVADRIRVVEKDHRDIVAEAGAYDRFVTIGVQEHAGKDCYDSWIASVAAALRDGGIGVISTTSLMEKILTNFIITKHIFPGGHIPSLPLILDIMQRRGLMLVEVENLWPHYQRTLQEWRRNLARHWPDIEKLDPAVFNERFHRRWTMYLEGTIENFSHALDLSHIVFTKGRGPALYDWTRERIRAECEFATGDMPVETWP